MTNRLTRSLAKRWRILTDPDFRTFRARIKRFKREQGVGTPSRFEGVGPGSTVFDFGGYEGEWTATMRRTYDCTVHVFEPHPTFAAALASRFKGDPKVICHDFALGAQNGTLTLSDSADASSVFVTEGAHVTGRLRAAAAFLSEIDRARIAAAKINIEGGEYDLLPALIASGDIERFDVLAIQFHDYSRGDSARRDAIRAALARTHDCVWNYDFVWECWTRRT
jgi:FkbM family methyltransferase